MLNALLATFQNEPALIADGMERKFEAYVARAAQTIEKIEAANDVPVMADDFWFSPDDWRSHYRPYVVKNGLLLIPVKGVLLHNFPWQDGSWATGYAYILKALERGLADANVKGIALIVDSPGGHVAGNFELVDKIAEARGKKPIRGYAADSAYSAAYNIIAAVDPGEVTITRNGGAGSIGVVTMHIDVSGAMAQAGIKITFIHAGKHKVDGNAYEALPADVKARIQARVDALYDEFVSMVARNRGMDEQAVRDTEALTFTAKEATSNGLADKIGSLDDAIAAFAADMSNQEDETMTTQDKAATFDQAAVDAARAEGKAEGHKEGVKAERDRRDAIMNSDAAKDRPTAAAAAVESGMDAEAAIAFMGKLPKETPVAAVEQKTDDKAAKDKAAAGDDFKAAMDKSKQPEAGSPGAKEEDDDEAKATGQTSRVSATLAALKGPKKAA